MGLLRVTGMLDPAQFWPQGLSDADTTKIVVEIGAGAFEFQADAAAPFTTTQVFDAAQVRGKYGRRPAVRNGRITVRLQGIDAPELHYRPARLEAADRPTDARRAAFKAVNKEYRQCFGESSAAALGAYVATGNGARVDCQVLSRVDQPNELFDTYGRLVGDILIERAGQMVNLNRWLVENGWAFPAFYVSMDAAEIAGLSEAWRRAPRNPRRPAGRYARTIPAFDPTRVRRPKGSAPEPGGDRGPVLLPKLYRRQTSWWARRRAGLYRRSFADYLRGKERGDLFYLTEDFLAHGAFSAPARFWSDYLRDGGRRFTLGPERMVYTEQPSTLLDADGEPVRTF